MYLALVSSTGTGPLASLTVASLQKCFFPFVLVSGEKKKKKELTNSVYSPR